MNEAHLIFNLHSKAVGVKVNISYDLGWQNQYKFLSVWAMSRKLTKKEFRQQRVKENENIQIYLTL